MREIRYYEALIEAQAEEMRRDESVFLMGEDIGLFGGTFRATEGLMAEFGARRVRDTPIAEAGIIGLAIGSALAGLRPVPELMTMNFAVVAMDQIINHAAKLRYMFGGQFDMPITIRAPGGGGTQKAAALPLHRVVVRQCAGHPRGDSVHAARRQGPAQDLDPQRRRGALRRARTPLLHEG